MTAPKKTTLADWKKAAEHEVTLASGTVVTIRIPNLPELVLSGEFPNHLVDTAIAVATGDKKVSSEDVKAEAEFYRELVARMLVEPALTPEEVTQVPFEDVELLASIGTRQRDIDALGHHIAGLHKSEEWRKFRQVEYFD